MSNSFSSTLAKVSLSPSATVVARRLPRGHPSLEAHSLPALPAIPGNDLNQLLRRGTHPFVASRRPFAALDAHRDCVMRTHPTHHIKIGVGVYDLGADPPGHRYAITTSGSHWLHLKQYSKLSFTGVTRNSRPTSEISVEQSTQIHTERAISRTSASMSRR